jgi:transcriptional regulator with XRE-family HTH domain
MAMQPRDEEMLAKRFAEVLVQLRTSQELSLRAAAKLIGIDHGRLFSLEQGIERTTGRPTLPSASQTIQIARAYRYPKERLLAEAGYIPWLLDPGQVDRMLAMFGGELSPTRRYLAAEHGQSEGFYGEATDDSAQAPR